MKRTKWAPKRELFRTRHRRANGKLVRKKKAPMETHGKEPEPEFIPPKLSDIPLAQHDTLDFPNEQAIERFRHGIYQRNQQGEELYRTLKEGLSLLVWRVK